MASSDQGANAPAWLFSFVDLAFLLLIAMTQLAEDTPGPELGEMIVPRIEAEATAPLPARAAERWQLRVHPPGPEPPFELLRATDAATGTPGERLASSALQAQLAALEQRGARKPLLAPHEDSRSQDLLDAVALLEDLWPGRRRTAVAPRLALR